MNSVGPSRAEVRRLVRKAREAERGWHTATSRRPEEWRGMALRAFRERRPIPHKWTKPGMMPTTRAAIEELTSPAAFRARVYKAGRKMVRSMQRKTIKSKSKRERKYYGRETSPEFTIRTYINPVTAAKRLTLLQQFGVPADRIHVVSECPHPPEKRRVKSVKVVGSYKYVEECGCSESIKSGTRRSTFETWRCGKTFGTVATSEDVTCGGCRTGSVYSHHYPRPVMQGGEPALKHSPGCEHDTTPLKTEDAA